MTNREVEDPWGIAHCHIVKVRFWVVPMPLAEYNVNPNDFEKGKGFFQQKQHVVIWNISFYEGFCMRSKDSAESVSNF